MRLKPLCTVRANVLGSGKKQQQQTPKKQKNQTLSEIAVEENPFQRGSFEVFILFYFLKFYRALELTQCFQKSTLIIFSLFSLFIYTWPHLVHLINSSLNRLSLLPAVGGETVEGETNAWVSWQGCRGVISHAYAEETEQTQCKWWDRDEATRHRYGRGWWGGERGLPSLQQKGQL